MNCEINRNAPLSATEKALGGLGMLSMLVALWLVAALFSGCRSCGVKVVASSATYTNIGDINWDEYKIPVMSVYTGPKVTIWVNRDFLALKKITGSGSVTNNTTALGIYETHEQKDTRLELEFEPVATNLVVEAEVKE